MKRIVVLALIVGTLFIAPMGAANAAACAFSIPQMPDDCISEAMYNYVTDLQADDLAQRTRAGLLDAENYQLRTQMWQMGADLTAAHQATGVALADRDAALAQVDLLAETVSALRAKVRVLKKRIKKLEAQLPSFVG